MTVINRIEAGIIIAGVFSIAIVGYSLYLLSSTVNELIPLIQASNDVKTKVTTAHLWLEEAMEGDRSILLEEQVFRNIRDAIQLTQMQSVRIQEIDSSLFDLTRRDLEKLQMELRDWEQQTNVRLEKRSSSFPGTQSDQIYDQTFQRIILLCDKQKGQIDELVSRRQDLLSGLHVMFILFLFAVFTWLVMLSIRYRGTLVSKNLDLMKLSQALEQTDDLVTITDQQGNIQYVNPSFEKLTGFTKGEVLGRKPSILKSGKHESDFYEQMWQTIQAGSVFRAEVINRKKDGDLFYEEKTISPIRDRQGNIIHFVSTAKDITQRKLLEKELMYSRSMKMLGQITSGVAHEVRNPLNAILAISEAMFQDLKGPEYTEYLDRIRKQVGRLSALMQDLLEIGKAIPASTMHVTPLRKLCANAIDIWSQYESAATHKVHVVEPSEDRCALSVRVNGGKLQQVFVNLLENAAQHSKDGSEIRIMIHEPEQGRVRVCIQDQGSGIPPENLDHVFEPFYTTRKSGTGLGLSIVKHIVETHGGKISIRNNDPLPGSCVEMQLPVIPDEIR